MESSNTSTSVFVGDVKAERINMSENTIIHLLMTEKSYIFVNISNFSQFHGAVLRVTYETKRKLD